MGIEVGARYNTKHGWVDVKALALDGGIVCRVAVPATFREQRNGHPRGTVLVLRPDELGERIPVRDF